MAEKRPEDPAASPGGGAPERDPRVDRKNTLPLSAARAPGAPPRNVFTPANSERPKPQPPQPERAPKSAFAATIIGTQGQGAPPPARPSAAPKAPAGAGSGAKPPPPPGAASPPPTAAEPLRVPSHNPPPNPASAARGASRTLMMPGMTPAAAPAPAPQPGPSKAPQPQRAAAPAPASAPTSTAAPTPPRSAEGQPAQTTPAPRTGDTRPTAGRASVRPGAPSGGEPLRLALDEHDMVPEVPVAASRSVEAPRSKRTLAIVIGAFVLLALLLLMLVMPGKKASAPPTGIDDTRVSAVPASPQNSAAPAPSAAAPTPAAAAAAPNPAPTAQTAEAKPAAPAAAAAPTQPEPEPKEAAEEPAPERTHASPGAKAAGVVHATARHGHAAPSPKSGSALPPTNDPDIANARAALQALEGSPAPKAKSSDQAVITLTPKPEAPPAPEASDAPPAPGE